MEKRTPHYDLVLVKHLVEGGRARTTRVALEGAAALGMGRNEIFAVVIALTPGCFYKSMTTYADHRVWQDVYRPATAAGSVYLKLTIVGDVVVVSFKEL